MHYLWNEDRVGPGLAGRDQVLGAPRRLERIDADDDLAPLVAAAFYSGAYLVSGKQFRIGCHSVFEIEDQGVGGNGFGFLEGSLV